MMQGCNHKVAVITRVGTSVGRAFANCCAKEGMYVLIADADQAVLACAERELRQQGATVSAVQADLSKAGGVQALALVTLDTYGSVDLLLNHLDGLSNGAVDWESSYTSSLWGMVQTLHAFVPIMLAQPTSSIIVNTAPLARYLSYSPSTSYQITECATAGATWLVTPTSAMARTRVIDSQEGSDQQVHTSSAALLLFDDMHFGQPFHQTANRIVKSIAEFWSENKGI